MGGLLLAQALKKKGRRFVVGVLGDEFAAEGFGEGGGSEALDGLLRGGEAGFDPVGDDEQVFDSADDFLLFGERGAVEEHLQWRFHTRKDHPSIFEKFIFFRKFDNRVVREINSRWYFIP